MSDLARKLLDVLNSYSNVTNADKHRVLTELLAEVVEQNADPEARLTEDELSNIRHNGCVPVESSKEYVLAKSAVSDLWYVLRRRKDVARWLLELVSGEREEKAARGMFGVLVHRDERTVKYDR